MTCVSLIACRREQHPQASCRDCGVITCRHALDVDGTCWRCERVPSWVERPRTHVEPVAPGVVRTVMARSSWCEVSFEIDDRVRRMKPARTHSRATSPADEVGRASGRPVDTRPQNGAQAARGVGAR